MKPSIERRLQLFGGRRIWRTVVADEDTGPGGAQNLGQVLATGNDAAGAQAKNLADGTDPQDAATVSQIVAGSAPDVSDGGTTNVIIAPDLIEFPNATVDEPTPGVARVVTDGGSQPGGVRVIKVPITPADFGPGDVTGMFAPVYELQPGDVLLARGMRVTEVFNDSGMEPDQSAAFQYYDQNLAQGDTFSVDNMLNPDPDGTGFVGLTTTTASTDDSWTSQITMTMADTVANTLGIYAVGMVGDGDEGAIDCYIVVATGIA